MAENVSLGDSWFSGEDKRIYFRIWTDPTLTTRKDISGMAVSWMVKRKLTHADSSALITKTTTGGGIAITDGVNGEGYVQVDDADIADIVPGNLYHHELKRVDATAETVWTHGTLMLHDAVHD